MSFLFKGSKTKSAPAKPQMSTKPAKPITKGTSPRVSTKKGK